MIGANSRVCSIVGKAASCERKIEAFKLGPNGPRFADDGNRGQARLGGKLKPKVHNMLCYGSRNEIIQLVSGNSGRGRRPGILALSTRIRNQSCERCAQGKGKVGGCEQSRKRENTHE